MDRYPPNFCPETMFSTEYDPSVMVRIREFIVEKVTNTSTIYRDGKLVRGGTVIGYTELSKLGMNYMYLTKTVQELEQLGFLVRFERIIPTAFESFTTVKFSKLDPFSAPPKLMFIGGRYDPVF